MVSQLIQIDPLARPTVEQILEYPYLSGNTAEIEEVKREYSKVIEKNF